MFRLLTQRISGSALRGADFVVEFSTLGEYRVGLSEEVRENVTPEDLWSVDVEWTVPRGQSRGECRLPRVHDRGATLAITAA